MRKALIYILTALMLIALLSGCDASDKQGKEPSTEQGGENKNENELELKLDKETDTYTVTGIGDFDGEELFIPSEYNKKAVTAVADHAFMANSKITSVTIPESITSIGEWAFCDCENLTEITLTDNLVYIGADAFSGTAYFKDEQKWEDGALYIGSYLISIKKDIIAENYSIRPDTKTVADFVFSYCESLRSVILPDSVINIGSRAFTGCSNLTEIELGKEVKHIGEGAFFECTALESIRFNGTMSEWEEITKEINWDYYSNTYTVTCSDGVIEPTGKINLIQ